MVGMNYDGQLMTDDDIYQHQNCTVAHTISKDRPSRDYPAVVIDSNQITAYIGGLMLCIIIPSTWLPNTMYRCTVYAFCLNWGVRDYDDDTSKSNSAKSNSASRSASTGTQETLLHAAYHSMPSLTWPAVVPRSLPLQLPHSSLDFASWGVRCEEGKHSGGYYPRYPCIYRIRYIRRYLTMKVIVLGWPV